MKKTTESVYRCDHCNKAIVSKGIMVTHERMCKKNPNNMHMCFKYCKHLKKGNEEGETQFYCALNPDVELYSYKLERYKRNADRIECKERMPLKCDLYETEEGHYFGEHFHEFVNYLTDECY